MAAIYMWPMAPGILVTTTPYPIEAIDKIQIQSSPASGLLLEIFSDKLSSTYDLTDITYEQKRFYLDGGLYEDQFESTYEFLDITYEQKRWYYNAGPFDDEFSTTYNLLDITYDRKRIRANAETERLDLSCTPSIDSVLENI